jgi:hypothetical protein
MGEKRPCKSCGRPCYSLRCKICYIKSLMDIRNFTRPNKKLKRYLALGGVMIFLLSVLPINAFVVWNEGNDTESYYSESYTDFPDKIKTCRVEPSEFSLEPGQEMSLEVVENTSEAEGITSEGYTCDVSIYNSKGKMVTGSGVKLSAKVVSGACSSYCSDVISSLEEKIKELERQLSLCKSSKECDKDSDCGNGRQCNNGKCLGQDKNSSEGTDDVSVVSDVIDKKEENNESQQEVVSNKLTYSKKIKVNEPLWNNFVTWLFS